MRSISLIDLLTIIFVLVDDWYQAKVRTLLKGKAGAKPEFTDSEAMTLILTQDYFPYPSETRFPGFIRANFLPCFPGWSIKASSTGKPGTCAC